MRVPEKYSAVLDSPRPPGSASGYRHPIHTNGSGGSSGFNPKYQLPLKFFYFLMSCGSTLD